MGRRDGYSFRMGEERRKHGPKAAVSGDAGLLRKPQARLALMREGACSPPRGTRSTPAGDLAAEDYLPGQCAARREEEPCIYNPRLNSFGIPLPWTELCVCASACACECTLKKHAPRFFLSAPSSLLNRPEVSSHQTSSAGTSGTGDQGSGRVLVGEGEAAATAAAGAAGG